MHRHALDREVENGIVVANELDTGGKELEFDERGFLRLVVEFAESEVVARFQRAVHFLLRVVRNTVIRDVVQRMKLVIHELGSVVSVVAFDAHGEETLRVSV